MLKTYLKTSGFGVKAAFIAAFVAGSMSSTAFAQEDTPVTSDLRAYVVTLDENGKESLMPAEQVKPGGVIEYKISYKNNTESNLGSFIVDGDVPANTTYVSATQDTNMNAKFQALIEDMGWVDVPAYRDVKAADGSMVRIEIPVSEYQKVRWHLNAPLEAGETVETTYRIKVNR